jgi:hypothetical protein
MYTGKTEKGGAKGDGNCHFSIFAKPPPNLIVGIEGI